MEEQHIEAIGYAVAMIELLLLTTVLLTHRKRGLRAQLLIVASGASMVWAGFLAAAAMGVDHSPVARFVVEWSRNIAWMLALFAMFGAGGKAFFIKLSHTAFGLLVSLVIIIPVLYYFVTSGVSLVAGAIVAGGYVTALLNVILAEQIYKMSTVELRAGLNIFCLAIIGLFAYDGIIYLQEIAGIASGLEWVEARGFANALMIVPLGLGIWRDRKFALDPQFPRQIIFHTVAVSVTLIIVSIAVVGQHYLRVYGGSWGQVASFVFMLAIVIGGVIFLVSPITRARARVAITKMFFAYKYDYRKEWLRFISTLSASAAEKVPTSAVRAVAQIVNSPGGVVWVQEDDGGSYSPIGSWRHEIADESPIENDSALVTFLEDRQWIIDAEEMKQHPSRYDGLQLNDVYKTGENCWLIVPMFLGRRLLGFITLQRPWSVPSLNFEDHDLLRTVGRHVAMHIIQAQADKQLAESSQFNAYNRLTAFLMHDLNNLIAQQSLVVKNAEKFRHDARFVDDAIETIANCVARMTRLMDQLSSGFKDPIRQRTRLNDVLNNAISRCRSRKPIPVFDACGENVDVLADPERLTYVFEHLIRNAQDATPEDGEIIVKMTLDENENRVLVKITDTGEGMSPQFIRERLFRPFDSTKGSQAMGIGACQARDYIRSLEGQLSVESEQGAGTTFTVQLAVYS